MNLKITLSILFLLLIACSKDLDQTQNEVFIIKKLIYEKDGQFVESYGLMNSKGKQLVGLNYKKIHLVGSDYFVAEKEDHSQQYFKMSNEVPLFDKEFEVAKSFSINGLARVKGKGKWGFINRDGDYIIPPLYDLVGSFSEGVAAIIIEGKVGFIDEEGKIIIEPKYDLQAGDYIIPEEEIQKYRFVDGLCAVNLDNNYGYINHSGKIEINTVYSYASKFYGEYAAAGTMEKGHSLMGIINKKGVWKVKPQFINVFLGDDYFIGLLPRIHNESNPFDFVEAEDEGFSYYKYDGSKMIDKVFKRKPLHDYTGFHDVFDLRRYAFSENMAFVCNDDSCGYVNKVGEYVIKPKYFPTSRMAELFTNGIAAVAFNHNQNSIYSGSKEDGYKGRVASYRPVGFIDKLGKLIIPPVFVHAEIYSSGIIEVTPKESLPLQYLLDHVFYIDYKGNYVWNGFEEK